MARIDPVLTKMERLALPRRADGSLSRPLDCPEGAGKRFRNPEAGGTYARCGRAAAPTGKPWPIISRDTLQTSPEAIIADYRYGFIRGDAAYQGPVRRESAKDRLELSTSWIRCYDQHAVRPLIMLGVLYAMFQLTFVIGAYPQGWVEDGFGFQRDRKRPDARRLLKSLIVSGVIDGLGGVMSFVPLIIIMFTLVDLELRLHGPHGLYAGPRVPRLWPARGFRHAFHHRGRYRGCTHPRRHGHPDLAQSQGKLATLLTLPYMACGAKLPVFLLLVGVFFENPARTMFLLTLAGWAAALHGAPLRSTIIRGESTVRHGIAHTASPPCA